MFQTLLLKRLMSNVIFTFILCVGTSVWILRTAICFKSSRVILRCQPKSRVLYAAASKKKKMMIESGPSIFCSQRVQDPVSLGGREPLVQCRMFLLPSDEETLSPLPFSVSFSHILALSRFCLNLPFSYLYCASHSNR